MIYKPVHPSKNLTDVWFVVDASNFTICRDLKEEDAVEIAAAINSYDTTKTKEGTK